MLSKKPRDAAAHGRLPALIALVTALLANACTGPTSASKVAAPPSLAATPTPTLCARVTPLLRTQVVRAAKALRPAAQSQNDLRTLADAVRLGVSCDARQALTQSPACAREALTGVFTDKAELRAFCNDYLLAAADAGRCQTAQGLALTTPGTGFVIVTQQDALRACAAAMLDIIERPAKVRKQLTIGEAMRLHKNREIAFHVTNTRNVHSILRTGLDPRLGGTGGLCDTVQGNDLLSTVRRNSYKRDSAGYTFFTTLAHELSLFRRIYSAAGVSDTSVLAIRFNGNITNYVVDQAALSAYKTPEWIWSEDIVAIPEMYYKTFDIQ